MTDMNVVLQTIEQGFEGVNARLDRLNGKVDYHTREIARLQADTHRAPCPIIESLQHDVVELQTNETVRRLTTQRLVAIASSIGAAFVVVAQFLLELLKR